MIKPAKPTVSVILPTRKRKDLLLRFLDSLKDACAEPELVEIVLFIDNDDDSYDGLSFGFDNLNILRGPREGMGIASQKAIDISNGDIIFLANDDSVVETYGWDEAFRGVHMSYPDRIYLGSPNDMYKNEKVPVFPFFSRRLAKMLHPIIPDYKGAFIDSHLQEIFISLEHLSECRTCFLDEVRFRHLHYRVTKEQPDQTYRERDRFGDDRKFIQLLHLRENHALQLSRIVLGGKKCDGFSDGYLAALRPASSVDYLTSRYLPIGYRVKYFLYLQARRAAAVLYSKNPNINASK